MCAYTHCYLMLVHMLVHGETSLCNLDEWLGIHDIVLPPRIGMIPIYQLDLRIHRVGLLDYIRLPPRDDAFFFSVSTPWKYLWTTSSRNCLPRPSFSPIVCISKGNPVKLLEGDIGRVRSCGCLIVPKKDRFVVKAEMTGMNDAVKTITKVSAADDFASILKE